MLGIQGNTGKSTGRHTHFCIREYADRRQVKKSYEFLEIPNELRAFDSHLEFEEEEKKITEDLIYDIIEGKYGDGKERKENLEKYRI